MVTRDVDVLQRESAVSAWGTLSLGDTLWQFAVYIMDRIGVGSHGLMRCLLGDYNDGIFHACGGDRAIFNSTSESVLNVSYSSCGCLHCCLFLFIYLFLEKKAENQKRSGERVWPGRQRKSMTVDFFLFVSLFFL